MSEYRAAAGKSQSRRIAGSARLRAVLSPVVLVGVPGIILSACAFACGQQAQDVPSNMTVTTRTYYDGADTIGRVGRVAILKRDILHQIKKFAHLQYLAEIEKLPEEEREERREEIKNGILNAYLNNEGLYSQVLDEHIRSLLFYNDYVVSRPKDQVKEQSGQLASEFSAKVVPELMDMFHCKTERDLEEYYENEIQIDFEHEKQLFVQQQLANLWMQYNLGEEDFTPTLLDLKRYYEANTDKYLTKPEIKWQSMTVCYGSGRSRDDARRKIAHMGNAVQSVDTKDQEKMFAEVCRVDSEDSFAGKGGYRTSTQRGVLKSQKLEDAIFSDELPVGALSMIIEDNSSFVIARVISRTRERVRSFTEVQEEVRDALVAERTEAMKKKYEERLSSRYSIEIYAVTQSDREKYLRSASRTELSATGRKPVY